MQKRDHPKNIPARPQQQPGELPLAEWNETDCNYPPPYCLHELFEEQVRRTPEAPAVVFGPDTLTYYQLNLKVNTFAQLLIDSGVQTESLVGVYMERSIELVVALMAIVKSGGAYVPIDPEYPAERIMWMLEDTCAPVLVTQRALESEINAEGATVLVIDDGLLDQAREGAEVRLNPVNPDNAAYVIFTSGSTGRPKGVINTHRGICNRLQWMQETFKLDEADRVLQKTPFSFDVSVWEFFWPLMTGAQLVVAKPGGHRDSAYLARVIEAHGITTLHFVPSMLAAFLDERDLTGCESVRYVICSGEALSYDLQERFFARLHAELHNLYGPTEAAVDVTHWPCQRGSDFHTVPIGYPIANTRLYILDKELQPVPVGTPGELHIGGVQVARGYLGRDELTAERFIPDTCGPNSDGHLYKTGDLARYLEDGAIEYLGRLDFQVKIRGFRIELGEIESALRLHEAVSDAVVIASEEIAGHPRLSGYILPDNQYVTTPGPTEDKVEQWQTIFDQTYSQAPTNQDETLNIMGWNSSYTGQPIPEEEMLEWVEHTVDRILRLQPNRVLEIGCGTGMLLFRIAPTCSRYVGCDLSRVGLETLTQQVHRRSLSQVELALAAADELDDFSAHDFDTVIINSVVQLFPGIQYLLEVLRNAADKVVDGGKVFVGDVRNLELLEDFHSSVELNRAPEVTSKGQVYQRIRSRFIQDDELVIAPEFFRSLAGSIPRVSGIELYLKRGNHHNELTRFRYDVVLTIGSTPEPKLVSNEITWNGLPAITAALQQQPDHLRVLEIPNARLASETRTLAWLASDEGPDTCGELKHELTRLDEVDAVDPETLLTNFSQQSYKAEICWPQSDRRDRFDLLFYKLDVENLRCYDTTKPGQSAVRFTDLANSPECASRRRAIVPQLRDHLKHTLPEYMIPSSFVLLEAFPVTPNGKLDRNSLPPPDLRPETESGYLGPRNKTEETLAQIWADALGLSRVGVRDNFFDLGGDSILNLQIISRANALGLKLTPAQLFKYHTVEELAEVIGTGPGIHTEQGVVDGEQVLTAMQHWVLEKSVVDPNHSNQVTLLDLNERLEAKALATALTSVIQHHDALRLSFHKQNNNWSASYTAPKVEAPLTEIDLSHVSVTDRIAETERHASQIHASLQLDKAPVLRVVLFEYGSAEPQKLLLSIHHLIVDGVSLRVVLEDLNTAYEQIIAGEAVRLPAKTTSFQLAADRLGELARSNQVEEQLSYWLDVTGSENNELPLDFPDGVNRVRTLARLTLALSEQETNTLLAELPKRYRAQVTEVLLSAFAQTLARWTGCNQVLLDTEGHGRETQLFNDVDLSRTVGTFSAMYPLLLDVPSDLSPVQALASTRQQMASLPDNGIGYGLLRYVRGEERIRQQLEQLPVAPVLFNYLGRFDQVLPAGSRFALSKDPGGVNRGPADRRTHVLEVNSLVTNGCLCFEWTYSSDLHREDTIRSVAENYLEALRALIIESHGHHTTGYIPSEFPLAGLNQAELDTVVDGMPEVEDIYPLSPLQNGMLFNALYAPESQVYYVQMSAELDSNIDLDAFRAAWQHVVDRHTILRTRLQWEGLPHAVQVVERKVTMPFEIIDLQHMGRLEQLEAIPTNRREGYTLTSAPLMCVRIYRLSDNALRMVWNFHHILLDGWSMTDLVEEVFTVFHQIELGQIPTEQESHSYGELLAWLKGRDHQAADQFWETYLSGFRSATALLDDQSPLSLPGQHDAYDKHSIEISKAITDTLKSLARQQRITINTLIQGSWALLLSHWSGENDVVFGTVVPGRPPDLPAAESIVGLFMNTLAVRARVHHETPVFEWLVSHQREQVTLRDYEHSPLIDVQQVSEIPAGKPMFESLIAVQGYLRGHGSLIDWAESLGMHDYQFVDWNSLPLSVAVDVGSQIVVLMKYDTRRFKRASVERMLEDFELLLNILTQDYEVTIGELQKQVTERREQANRDSRSALRESAGKKLGKISRRRPK